jgi:pyruvate formate lyase activating enzyme
MNHPLKEAQFYLVEENKIRCLLCPHNCIIQQNQTGICRVRRNQNGRLISEIYGKLSAVNFDPVEKKPLYHFHPGTLILSIGTVGCNMHCKCCQNWQISQGSVEDFPFRNYYRPEDIVNIANSREENIGVAFTYNEPSIWFEYITDVAPLIKQSGLKNVMVSNGFISAEPLQELLQYIDAFNIDLKAFSDDFYKHITGARLKPVLDTLVSIKQSGKHLEITNLVIPTLNDNKEEFSQMARWIARELGPDTVLHLSRYHPMYKLKINSTSAEMLIQLAEIARQYLWYVYIGNIEIKKYHNTRCHNCGSTVIQRVGYYTEITGIDEKGLCKHCRQKIVIQ